MWERGATGQALTYREGLTSKLSRWATGTGPCEFGELYRDSGGGRAYSVAPRLPSALPDAALARGLQNF